MPVNSAQPLQQGGSGRDRALCDQICQMYANPKALEKPKEREHSFEMKAALQLMLACRYPAEVFELPALSGQIVNGLSRLYRTVPKKNYVLIRHCPRAFASERASLSDAGLSSNSTEDRQLLTQRRRTQRTLPECSLLKRLQLQFKKKRPLRQISK